MTTFALKLIACILMLIDHIGTFIPNAPLWFHWVGRLSAPIFIYSMLWGIHYTKSKKTYVIRMYIFSVSISLINTLLNHFFVYYGSFDTFVKNNIFTTLFAISSFIILHDYCQNHSKGKKIWKYYCLWQLFSTVLIFLIEPLTASGSEMVQILSSITGNIFYIEFGFKFLILGLVLNSTKDSKLKLSIYYASYCFIYFILTTLAIVPNGLYRFNIWGLSTIYEVGMEVFHAVIGIDFFEKFASPLYINYQWMMIGALPFMFTYNKKKGRNAKYFFYFFYPIHIYILWLIGNIK